MRWHSCVLLLCTACSAVNECPAVAPAALSALPAKLSETGLTNARSYTPRFELWSDGAHKRRWMSLPAGSRIDTSDMNAWQFPIGTRLWKEFAFDGIVAETRMMERTEKGWTFVAYAWNGDASDATQLPLGGAATTVPAHDIPAADQCFGYAVHVGDGDVRRAAISGGRAGGVGRGATEGGRRLAAAAGNGKGDDGNRRQRQHGAERVRQWKSPVGARMVGPRGGGCQVRAHAGSEGTPEDPDSLAVRSGSSGVTLRRRLRGANAHVPGTGSCSLSGFHL